MKPLCRPFSPPGFRCGLHLLSPTTKALGFITSKRTYLHKPSTKSCGPSRTQIIKYSAKLLN